MKAINHLNYSHNKAAIDTLHRIVLGIGGKMVNPQIMLDLSTPP